MSKLALRRSAPAVLTAAAAAVLALPALALPASASAHQHPALSASLTQVSTDPYTDSQAQHATEVEPDTFSYGNTIVAGFQVGRVSGGGASNIGWATSTDGGATWTHGFLPNTTANTGGPYGQTSDASVAYDAKHGQWLISWLGINGSAVDVEVSRSSDGKTWGNPIQISSGTFDDKNWTVCDNHSASPYYGNCYTEYDDANAGDAEHMRTSTDGGLTWGSELSPADNPSGLGGQPVVQPNGTVVVPFSGASSSDERAFTSTNGGASWGSSVRIATVSHHPVAGLESVKVAPMDSLRESPLPSAEIDSAGKVYVVWSDCRFRSSCTSNDIILSTSTNGTSWSSPTRVPIDAVTSSADHFTPGIGVDPSSSGSSARIGLTYYYYPQASCTDTTCSLNAAYVSSADGGATWTSPTQLAGPMTLAWLPNTSQGRMFGDYISTSVLAGGNAYPVIPVAHAPNGSTFDVAMYAPSGGLPIGGGQSGNTVTVTNPGNQTGTVGTAASLQITATDSSSSATLSYSASGLPAGLSINASSGLISGTPTTAATYTVTVTATDNTGASGSTQFTWTINPSGGGTCSSTGQKLGNPGFESGNTVWSASSGVIGQNGTSEPAHSGTWDAWLDGYGSSHTDTLTQSVTIPSGCKASLSFWLHIDTAETTTTTAYDTLTVKAGSTTVATYSNLNANSGYAQKTFDVSALAGQTITISFTGVEDSSLQTSFVIDDTALTLS